MNLLGINASPRSGGNTSILLDKALEAAKISGANIEKVVLNTLKFVPCQECAELPDDVSCIIKDDMQLVYEKLNNADALILAAPIFFGSLSAQAKMMIDRFQCVWRAKYILNKEIFKGKKRGAFISVQATRRKDFFENAKAITKNFFASVNIDYQQELACFGVDAKAAILGFPEYMRKAEELGRNIVK